MSICGPSGRQIFIEAFDLWGHRDFAESISLVQKCYRCILHLRLCFMRNEKIQKNSRSLAFQSSVRRAAGIVRT